VVATVASIASPIKGGSKMTLKEAIRNEKLSDELDAIAWTNIAQLPGESYEDNLKRRAALQLRRHEILSQFSWA
jgi:hypothetical protein